MTFSSSTDLRVPVLRKASLLVYGGSEQSSRPASPSRRGGRSGADFRILVDQSTHHHRSLGNKDLQQLHRLLLQCRRLQSQPPASSATSDYSLTAAFIPICEDEVGLLAEGQVLHASSQSVVGPSCLIKKKILDVM